MTGRIAGTTLSGQATTSPQPQLEGASFMGSMDGIPLDVLYYFNLDTKDIPDSAKSKLSQIIKYVNPTSMTDLLSRMRVVENKLGAPNSGETRYDKIWNYLRIQNHINNLIKQQESL